MHVTETTLQQLLGGPKQFRVPFVPAHVHVEGAGPRAALEGHHGPVRVQPAWSIAC